MPWLSRHLIMSNSVPKNDTLLQVPLWVVYGPNLAMFTNRPSWPQKSATNTQMTQNLSHCISSLEQTSVRGKHLQMLPIYESEPRPFKSLFPTHEKYVTLKRRIEETCRLKPVQPFSLYKYTDRIGWHLVLILRNEQRISGGITKNCSSVLLSVWLDAVLLCDVWGTYLKCENNKFHSFCLK